MSIRPANLAFLLSSIAVLLGVNTSAQAGFVSATVEQASVFRQTSLSSSGPVNAPSKPVPSRLELQEWEYLALLTTPGSPGGMTSQTVSHSTPSFLSATLTADSPSEAQLQVWREQQEESYHPRFLVSRLFRPPRS